MSSLLEQAIVDANALKDAAIKNAENLVIEKYSEQIKQAVDVFLEQEDEEEDPLADLGAEEDPLAATEEDPLAAAEELPGEEPGMDAEPDLDQAVLDPVSSSQTGQVELDLDAIEKAVAEIEDSELDGDKVEHEELAASMDDDIMASADADSLATETLSQLEEELEDMFVDSIMESLKVDIKPQKRGWMAVSDDVLDHAVEMELARVQDDEVKEQLEALKSALGKLEESNTSLKSTNKNLLNENKELTAEVKTYQNAVEQLKEKFDAVNTSNAKLLYINRTLDCNSLNERQKKKIVESIAKAEDAKEAKVIYETLQSSMETQKVEQSPESLNEAASRRSSLLVRSREENRTTSADIFADRMQRLAGIKHRK